MRETEWFEGRSAEQEPRLTALPWALWAVMVLVCVIVPLALAGCASSRYLSEEQDAKMRELCDQGCAIIPAERWKLIEELMRRLGIET